MYKKKHLIYSIFVPTGNMDQDIKDVDANMPNQKFDSIRISVLRVTRKKIYLFNNLFNKFILFNNY